MLKGTNVITFNKITNSCKKVTNLSQKIKIGYKTP